MTDGQERWRRWDPIEGLDDDVVATVSLHYEDGTLTLTAIREKGPDVRLHFINVEAFKAYEEFSDVSADGTFDVGRMGEAGWNYPWPFQEVERSSWQARVIERNGAIDERQFRHCVVRSFDIAVHVMFVGEPQAELLR